VVKKCNNCTVDRGFIGGAANGEGTTLEITETGGPSQLLPSVGDVKSRMVIKVFQALPSGHVPFRGSVELN
jgi:hypothetical protein